MDRYRLEHLRLDPRINAAEWKTFLAAYFAAAERMIAAYRHARLTALVSRSATDARGQTETSSCEDRSLRSGAFASLRHRASGFEVAYPRPSASITRGAPHRNGSDCGRSTTSRSERPSSLVIVPAFSSRSSTRPDSGPSRRSSLSPRILPDTSTRRHVVAALERFTENGRPRVRVRIEDLSPADQQVDWRAMTYVLAADDLYAVQSERSEGGGRDNGTSQSEFTYDRHDGIPVLRSRHTTTSAPTGPTRRQT